jgi:type II secretory pathway pseudopilin PulG
MRPGWRNAAGFTLADMIITVALFGVVSAITIPSVTGAMDTMRVRMAARDVERELQSARFLAVSANRPIRVRFNCPVAGQYRMVELIGSPESPETTDDLASRCGERAFPYPAADSDPLTRPNLDGPVRWLPTGVSFAGAQTVEFWPDGTAHADGGSGTPWPRITTERVAISVENDSLTQAVEVNGRGKIRMQ